MSKKEKFEKFFNELSDNIDIDFLYHISYDEDIDFHAIVRKLEEDRALDIEVIYYSVAIEYLQKNDPSLSESMGLASDMGYDTENLSSEILASLLASKNLRDELNGLKNEITEFLDELEEEDDEDENE